MSRKEEFEYQSIQDNQSIRQYLQALIDGFESGRIVFNTDGQEIALIPGELLEFAIKAKRRGDKNKITMKFTWKDAPPEAGEPGDLLIFT